MLQKFEMVYTKEKDLLISQDGKLYDKKILLEKMDEFKTSRCPTISVIVYGDLQSNIHINPAGIFAIIKDMNQALSQTISVKENGFITPDTIINYRQHLKIDALRNHSFIYYASSNKGNVISSKKIKNSE